MAELIFEYIIVDYFQNLIKHVYLQFPDSQKPKNRKDLKENTHPCIIDKLPKTKDSEKTLKATRNSEIINMCCHFNPLKVGVICCGAIVN